MKTLVVLCALIAACLAGYGNHHGGGYKYGRCPYRYDYGAMGQSCFNDYQCYGRQKCCRGLYGYSCQVPIEFQRPGRCPHVSGSGGTSYCNVDTDCYYGQKCCTGYGGDVNTCKYTYYGVAGPYGPNPLAGGVNFGAPFVNPGAILPAGGSVVPGFGIRPKKVY